MGLKKKVCIVWIILSYAVTYSYSQNIFSCGKYCSCESNKDGNTIANCSLRNLKAIPLDLPNNITDLNLSWNQINLQSALHPPLCTIYGNLSTLTLAWNNIEKMSQVLTGCDKLVQLDLTGNKLQNLNAKTFLGLGKLVTLQGLEVVNIEAETFKRVPNLQSLNFTYYGTFPNLRLFKDLHYLRELEIYLEKIARPDATLFHFERNNSLKILKLNSPLVKFFPNTLLSGLKNLEYLSFSAPSLSLFTLPKEGKPLQLKRLEIFNVRKVDSELLSGMSQLEVLKLHSVKNTDKLKLVPSIRDLEVFETTMNSIPDNWLFNLTFLVSLNLSEIPLDKIEHKDIIHLKSLKFLEISGNAMTVLPSNFLEPLKFSLEKFKMHHCDLSKLDDNAISSMMVLQEIDLSNNYIEWIGEGNFVNMPYLRKLNLQNNIIHTMQINKGWFTTASELREINLSNNNLNNFPEALLDTNLTELALAGNNISVLPAQKLCGLESLSVLILADNPIHCDLSTEKLLNCLPGLQVDGKCETPSNVRNCMISELEICLHKLSSTSVTSEPTSTETKNSTKKRVMNMIQQDTESDVIVRPIVTLRYDEAVANSKSEVIQPSISTADNVEIAKLFGNEANRNTVISDQLLQKKQKENMKNDSDTTSNNTVHNAMNKSKVATSNISDEDTETFSLQAQKVNNSQIEPLSQLLSNMNNSLNDSTTVSNSFQSKYINMNNSVTDSASSNITSQSNYITVNNFTTERFTVDNTSQSTNISISNFTTNSATGDNILIFEQSSNQQIYIHGENDPFLNINDSLIPIKTQEYNDTLNNTKVNLVAEMDQVSKPFEDLSTNTAGNKTFLNNTFSLLAGTANVSMDIAQGDNINKPSVGSQSKVSKENDQPKWNASNITLDISSSKPFTANKNMSIYGIKSVDNTLFQVNTSEAENPGKELKQSFKSDLQNMSIINESTATPFKNVHTFQSYTKTTNNNVPMADWLTLSSSVKENLVLKNDSEMEGGINQVIQHTQGSYLSRSKGVEKTSPNSDSKPTLHSQDIKSQSLSNIEALSNNSYGPSSTPSESIFGPDSQIKIPAKEPVPVHIKEVEHTESPLGSLIATLIVVTLLILVMGGGFLWFKKYWQTGSYNAATRGSGQVDQVNISLASINQTN
ncbi:leucine-rich repeat-containing G-protein coupled receptor 4 [Biomphalaria pfeifferi]|uniref:Leucine-rich repeat-containing G-protein coupled receptor 4 n=1 Tax=Biomphalaria pfeifferi TaxID=112525 RepID=A0AAD8C0K6_BIOPF|nr:leucine-rich repeat-containing G-protein coupled receptor 4 [Biomphalaria pfeifferi]